MREFDHPPARFKSRVFFYKFLLLSSGSDVRYKAVGYGRFFFAHVSRVQTQVLDYVFRGGLDNSSFQQRLKRDTIVPVGSGDDD